mgnify:CR=1 FL=1
MTTPDPEVTVDADDDALSAEVTAEYAGLRLDVVCAKLFDQYSRARLQQWICEGRVKVDGAVLTRSREPVAEGGVIMGIGPAVTADVAISSTIGSENEHAIPC